MSDWLIDNVQQWDNTRFPEFKGRFYSTGKDYGPPHSSSTGVYLEGLIDSFELARKHNKYEKLEKYRLSILRGLRSVLQNQFNKKEELFYIDEPIRAWGGIRTTVYNNEIRVDNTQHNLLAVIKITNTFGPSDYMPSRHIYSGKRLRNLTFKNKNMLGSQFIATRAQNLTFTNVDLSDSNLSGFYCKFCKFNNVDFSGIDLTTAVLVQPQFSNIKVNQATRFPSSIHIADKVQRSSGSLK